MPAPADVYATAPGRLARLASPVAGRARARRHARFFPLAAVAPGMRVALEETLRSWLVHMGDTAKVAAELQVHPQTVRYRLGRLRELFGAELDDPDTRLELLLALAWG